MGTCGSAPRQQHRPNGQGAGSPRRPPPPRPTPQKQQVAKGPEPPAPAPEPAPLQPGTGSPEPAAASPRDGAADPSEAQGSETLPTVSVEPSPRSGAGIPLLPLASPHPRSSSQVAAASPQNSRPRSWLSGEDSSPRSIVSVGRVDTAAEMGLSVQELTVLSAGLQGKSAVLGQHVRNAMRTSAAGSGLPSEVTGLTAARVIGGLATHCSPRGVPKRRETVQTPGRPPWQGISKWLSAVVPRQKPFDEDERSDIQDVDDEMESDGSLSAGPSTLRGSERAAPGDPRWEGTKPYVVVSDTGAKVRKGYDLLSPYLFTIGYLVRIQVIRIEGNRAQVILFPHVCEFEQGWVTMVTQQGERLIAQEGDETLLAEREKARLQLEDEWRRVKLFHQQQPASVRRV
eukprot:TRINITY_DN1673_c0_g1_i1.p1 TRINITY_DN1673_c0_g1~~TRINITY_DN1673_c0_g1_i1.p1  ORF type:complete len:400 (+),score=93.90 TRINITY_DN1673_c0_g1_i1:65-1264(+)